MPKQVQAQQQTVIVKVAAPEKKRRKRKTKRKPRQPTGEDIYQASRPIAVYQPLQPRDDYGSQFRELISAVTMLKAKQDAQASFTPEYRRPVRPSEMVEGMVEGETRLPAAVPPPEPEPAPAPEPEPTETEPPAVTSVATTTADAPLTKNQITNLTKFMRKIGFSLKALKKGDYSAEDIDDIVYMIRNRSQSADKERWISYVESMK